MFDNIFLLYIVETIVVAIVLWVVLIVIDKFIKSNLYKYDNKKQRSILNSFKILLVLFFILFTTSLFIEDKSNVAMKIFEIILTLKIIYQILVYYFIKKFGREIHIEEEIFNDKLKDELIDKYKSKILKDIRQKDINKDNLYEYLDTCKIKIELNPEYILKKNKLYKSVSKFVSDKTTSLIDIGLIVILSVFAVALILPIIKPLNVMFNNDYMFALLAFIGAYVLNPAFPDMYAFFTFVRNKNIDLEKFISFSDNGKIVKGRIIEMSTSHIILKDHVHGITMTIPNMNLHNKVINNLDDIYDNMGFKRVLEYVVDFDSYNADFGIKLKSICKEILDKFQKQTKLISKQSDYNVWLISDNNGIKIKLWYFITDIEKEEKIKLDLEDFILYEMTKVGFDLRTPKLVEIINNTKGLV